MTRIRTRETYEGPVRTIDRDSIISKMMRQTSLRTREGIRQAGGNNQDQNESGVFLAKDAAIKGFKEAKQFGKFRSRSEERAFNEKYEQIMSHMSTDVIIIDPDKEYGSVIKPESKFIKSIRNTYQNGKNIYQNSKESPLISLYDIRNIPERPTKQVRNLSNAVRFQAEKGEDILKRQYRTKKAREALGKKTERSGKKILSSLKRAVASEKTMTAALAIAGSIALISIIVCTFFGSAFYSLGDEGDPDFIPEDFIGIRWQSRMVRLLRILVR